MNCPICNARIKMKSYSDEVWGASTNVENDSSCPRCDYRDFDSYGGYWVSFYKYRWVWSWGTPVDERNAIQEDIMNKIVERAGKPSFTHREYRYFDYPDEIPF